MNNYEFIVGMADLRIRIACQSEHIQRICAPYIINGTDADFTVETSDGEIAAEQTGEFGTGYCESVAVYRKIANALPAYNGFVMHGAIIEVNGVGIAFLAKSGTGKTTHVHLWRDLLGERMTIINGDKPILRFTDGKCYAYGTPWAGKEGEQTNKRCVLQKIVFLERGKENRVDALPYSSSLLRMLPFMYLENGAITAKALKALNSVEKPLKFYRLQCNMDISAAETAYRSLLG